ncbi:MAG: branched-chain amino acid transaminase [Candidatus Thermoplasmatota archaeon]|nr:branched-chain amino acid transaminase [Candidatus Thermoplasmatota archaeon]MCL5954518.1 branched-chain amino acid transaminase [Candidatus Thermoplasmatota archaeon]
MENSRVWFDGKITGYNDVKVPLLTHSLQYGSGIFEGIRAYDAGGNAAIFRLEEHVDRFMRSARIYRMGLRSTRDEIMQGIIDVVRENKYKSCYLRPFAFFNDDSISLQTKGKKVSVAVVGVPYNNYFGDTSNKGVTCKVAGWRRINSDILPIQAKASGNYLNSVAAIGEADAAGFDEAILLSRNGYIAEGPGENIFLVKDGKLVTPGLESDILFGITRFSLIELAGKMGIEVTERQIHRDELYTCDEAFFCGTAAEVTPIVNVDGITIGDGKPGQLTEEIGKKFMGVVSGRDKEYLHWLTFVK